MFLYTDIAHVPLQMALLTLHKRIVLYYIVGCEGEA